MLSRRDFMKGIAGGVVCVGTSGIMGVNAIASSDANEEYIIAEFTRTYSEIEIEAEMKAQMAKVELEMQNLTRDVGEAYVEWGNPIDKTVSGYPGNQPLQGVYYDEYGGSIGYTPNGGASSSFAIDFSIPFGVVNVSISLGLVSGSAGVEYHFNVPPNAPGYYKLFVFKTVTIKPYITYYRLTPGDPWTPTIKSYTQVFKNVKQKVAKLANV